MARQRDSRAGHHFFGRRGEDPDPNRLYSDKRFDDQWNKVTRLYKPTNASEVREFLSKSPNVEIIDYLIEAYEVIANIFYPDALLLELFQDPEIADNRHLVALIGVQLPPRKEIIEIKIQGEEDISIPPFDDVARRLDTIIEWWLNTVPRALLDIVYFDIFEVCDSGRGGDEFSK
jgi:hypothetical protein